MPPPAVSRVLRAEPGFACRLPTTQWVLLGWNLLHWAPKDNVARSKGDRWKGRLLDTDLTPNPSLTQVRLEPTNPAH